MSPWLVSLLVFAIILGGALLWLALRPYLSEHHLHSDSRDVVKVATGLIGTLAALVLGLLIASAKTSFDQKTNQVRQMTASVILLDNLLAQYGPETNHLRILLRRSIPPLADRIWHEEQIPVGNRVQLEPIADLLAFEKELQQLSPATDAQRSLQARAVQTFTEGAQTRLQLFTQTEGSIPTPFLIVLVFWLSTIFLSFTLFARTNLIVTIALFVCAMSFAGAIFLILELDNPFAGLMGISSTSLRSALH